MKRFKAFLIKEFHHIFRDSRSLAILFGIPIIQIMLFGFVITNEIKDAKIAIYDKSKDPMTLKISQKILSSGYFKLHNNINNQEEIEKYFRQGIIKQVIVFEPEFAQKLKRDGIADLQIIGDASDPNTANLLSNFTKAIVYNFIREQNPHFEKPMEIIPRTRMLFNPELKGVYMFIPGIMALLLMLISAMMTSISITREKEVGTMEILLVSPLNPAQIIIGKVAPYVVLSLVNAIVIISLGNIVFGVPVLGNVFLLIGVTMLFITTALTLGILISSIAPNQLVAMMVSLVGLMLPTVLLSGFIFPIDNMPLVLRIITNIVPAKWYVITLKNIMLKGTGFLHIWKEVLILLFMTMFFFIVSIKKFKIRLE